MPEEAPGRLAVAGRSLLAALTLLTIVPVPAAAQRDLGAREVAASAGWFPVVGALVGLVVGVVAVLVGGTPIVTGALVAVGLALATGALHLDGLADAADALGARGGSRERRLEIMRDPSTGAYGTTAIVGWFALVTAAAASLPADALIGVLVLAVMLGRVAAVGHALTVPPARVDGLGAGFVPGGRARLLTCAAGVVVVGLVLLVGGATDAALPPTPGATLGLLLAAAAAPLLVGVLARRLLGGRTGDTLGATVALTEAACLVGAVALW